MAENAIMAMVGAFIAVAIMLSVGVVILGNSQTNCTSVTGYNSTTPSASTGWGLSCYQTNTQTQSAYNLLIVVLIVIAAVVILTVIKML